MEPVERVLWSALDEAIVLALLHEEPRHGYAIYSRIQQSVDAGIRKSRIYSLLHELEEEGLSSSVEVPNASGPSKRVYELTDAGRTRLDAYQRLDPEFRELLGGVLLVETQAGIEGNGYSPSQVQEHRVHEAPSAQAQEKGQERGRLPPHVEDAWVQACLEALPRSARIKAPAAQFSLSRSPAGKWQLVVENHEPGSYEAAGECPLTFLYRATVRLLLDASDRK